MDGHSAGQSTSGLRRAAPVLPWDGLTVTRPRAGHGDVDLFVIGTGLAQGTALQVHRCRQCRSVTASWTSISSPQQTTRSSAQSWCSGQRRRCSEAVQFQAFARGGARISRARLENQFCSASTWLRTARIFSGAHEGLGATTGFAVAP